MCNTKYSLMLGTYYSGKVYCEYSPLHIYIEPTNYCNLSCSHCPQRITDRKKGFMDLELYKQIIDQCNKLRIEWVYLFLLGESTLHKDFLYMVDHARKIGIKTRLHTNGLSDVSDIEVDSLHISANETNINQIKPNIEMLIQKGKPFKIVIIEGIDSKIKELYPSYIYEKKLSNWKGFINENKENSILCSHPFKSFAILWDGTCVPCCVDYDGAYIIGDAKNESLEKIWNSEKMQAIREHPIKMCRNCNHKSALDPETEKGNKINGV